MLTEAQKRELDSLVASMQAAGKTKQEIQAAVDSRKAEMLGENTVKEATKTEPTAPVEVAKPIAEEVIDESPIIPPEEFDISTLLFCVSSITLFWESSIRLFCGSSITLFGFT